MKRKTHRRGGTAGVVTVCSALALALISMTGGSALAAPYAKGR